MRGKQRLFAHRHRFSMDFLTTNLHTICRCLHSLWLRLFYRFVLYPLLGLVQRRRILDVQFLNLGFGEDPGTSIRSEAEAKALAQVEAANFSDNVDGHALKAHCLLYERTLAQCPLYCEGRLEGLTLLEVGCGPGGGLQWLRRAHPELCMPLVGLDLHPLTHQQKSTEPTGVTIFRGRAQSLPFAASSFHLILNVESSHCYGVEGGEASFFREAQRVLLPGGFLCWADLRTQGELSRTLELAEEAGLKLVAPLEQLNANVLRGMHRVAARYELLIDRAPWWLRLFRHSLRTAFSPGASGHEKLARAEHLYMIGCWQKL